MIRERGRCVLKIRVRKSYRRGKRERTDVGICFIKTVKHAQKKHGCKARNNHADEKCHAIPLGPSANVLSMKVGTHPVLVLVEPTHERENIAGETVEEAERKECRPPCRMLSEAEMNHCSNTCAD